MSSLEVSTGATPRAHSPGVNPARSHEYLPQVVPTPCHSRALKGSWSLDGRIVKMFQEPDTGVLVALNDDGRKLNPLRVISRGRKLDVSDRRDGTSGY